MAGRSHPKDGVASLAYVPAIHVLVCATKVVEPGSSPGVTTARAMQRAMADDDENKKLPGLDEATAPHYHGHRERLRERFRGSSEAVTDYELLLNSIGDANCRPAQLIAFESADLGYVTLDDELAQCHVILLLASNQISIP